MKEKDLSAIKRYPIVEYLERKASSLYAGHLPMPCTVHRFVRKHIRVSR